MVHLNFLKFALDIVDTRSRRDNILNASLFYSHNGILITYQYNIKPVLFGHPEISALTG